jgi:hypothetical protein
MEYLLNIIKHMRSPLAFCASAKAVDTSWSAFKEKEDVANTFYRIYAGSWERFSGIHNVFTPESTFDQSASQFLRSQRDEEAITSPAPRQIRVLGMMGLPSLKSAIFSYTENVEILLQEGKRVVPDVLNHDLNNLDEFLCSNHGFFRVGSATGEGFSCTVYRKSFDTGHRTTVPVYVIMGDLDITVDEFHALACDTDFRHQWDDQFHHVESFPIDSPQSLTRLLKWTSKWPWPMAAREYNYVLEPHVFDDGTRLVMAASVDSAESTDSRPISTAVPVKEYFGITAAKAIGDQKCRYCVFHFDDPRVGKMPKWIETYVANTLLPSFPKKLIEGAKKYPKERLVVFTSHYNS